MNGDRFVLSPYLIDPGDPELAGSLRRRLGADVRVLFDMSRFCSVALTPADQALLEEHVLAEPRTPVPAPSGPDHDAFRELVRRGVLLSVEEAYRKHRYTSVEVEINRHCNFRCSFCPVKVAPKPREFMPEALYRLVLGRVKEYGAPLISLNAYSEPTLDPLLLDRIAQAKDEGLLVKLFTNASLLEAHKIEALAAAGNIKEIVVNLPTVDPEEYGRVTGTSAKIFRKVVHNLGLLSAAGLPVSLSINSPRDRAAEDVSRINAMFAEMFGPSVRAPTNSRAGFMSDPSYCEPVTHTGELNGCVMSFLELPVSYEGKAVLCFQDYAQDYVLGDLREQSIRDIAEGPRAVELRRWLFGPGPAPAELICTSCAWTSSPARRFEPGGQDATEWRRRVAGIIRGIVGRA